MVRSRSRYPAWSLVGRNSSATILLVASSTAPGKAILGPRPSSQSKGLLSIYSSIPLVAWRVYRR